MNIFFPKCTLALDYATENKSFGVFYSTENNPNLNIHTHDCCEVFFCLRGGKNFLINEKVYNVNDGDVFVLNQFEAHKILFHTDCDVERYVLQLHPDYLLNSSTKSTNLAKCFYTRSKGAANQLSLSTEEKEYLHSLFLRLKEDHKFGDDVIKNSVMNEILVFLNSVFDKSHLSEEYEHDVHLVNAIDYINEHITEELSLDSIAKNSFISTNHLCKIFKISLGTTVNKYIVGRRIALAKKCLHSGMSVSDTAYECGFKDYSNFIRTFTSHVGVSPGKYKKNDLNI